LALEFDLERRFEITQMGRPFAHRLLGERCALCGDRRQME
jgi:hypothetical protein